MIDSSNDSPAPKRLRISEAAPDAEAKTATVGARAASSRLVSLDAFRGLTIFGMLLVNNIALDTATPKQLTHADWNQGVQFADLVFPWFLLIVGVAIPFADASSRAKGWSWWARAGKILRRTIALVLLGCLIDSSIAHQPILDLGVLQIIGLAYLLAALAYSLPLIGRALLVAVLLGGHGAFLQFAPVPGCGPGIQAQTCNVVDYINQHSLQQFHLSGLLSAIPTAALALIGAGIGDLLRRDRLTPARKVVWLIGCGVALAAMGWLWGYWLPMNKAVWSGSYILYTGGLGVVTLAFFYALLDARGWSRIALPLTVLGANAITAYVAPILFKVYILQSWMWTLADGTRVPLQQAMLHSAVAELGPVGGGVAYTAGYIAVCWLVLTYLYRRGVFLRV
ncbi:acyltransferase family protein [Capsulimonas corticalis]|nr:heparan-alpha-glucosaminide N-acetyltransferase domain-containing protein [Capsulimonas corticalis]